MAVIGSSYFRGTSAVEITGPTGNTGSTGATGATGTKIAGPTGFSGGYITDVYLTDDKKLRTDFTWMDGSTSEYTTYAPIIGPTGNTETLIYGGNTYATGIEGVTVFSSQNSSTEITIRSIEGTGGSLSVTESATDNTINIHFDRGNFGYINVDGGSKNQLVGGDVTGLTGATYSNSSVNVKIKSYKENAKYLVHGSDFVDTATGYKFNNDGLDANGFGFIELDMTQVDGFDPFLGSSGPIDSINIKDASFGYTGNVVDEVDIGKSFTLIVKGATYGIQNNFQFQNTIWPYDRQPCFSGGTDIFNFFWLPCDSNVRGGIEYCPDDAYAWHGNIIQWKGATQEISNESGNNPFFCNNEEMIAGEILYYPEGATDFDFLQYMNFGLTGATGACCLGDGECIHAAAHNCSGHFHGAGTTCGATSGSTGSICFDKGACCIHYQSKDEIDCLNDVSSDECISLGNLSKIDTTFGGIDVNCRDMNCSNISEDIGACCDGRGECSEISESACLALGYFFQRRGSVCTLNDGTSVCSGGTGACCFAGGTCGTGITGNTCILDGNLYAGIGTNCNDVKCQSDTKKGCSTSVRGLDLRPGDEFAGGIVVGLYRPFGSNLYGSSSFGKGMDAEWNELMVGSTADLSCDNYISKYDYHGYGFTSESGCKEFRNFEFDAYYIIVSPSPIAITGDRELVNILDYPGATHEFYWSNHGSSWGPLYNPDTGIVSPINSKDVQGTYNCDDYPGEEGCLPNFLSLEEGYWYNQNIGDDSLNVLGSNTFNFCKKARAYGNGYIQKLTSKPNQTAHGLWNRNWGMYNNTRIIGSDNALYTSKYGDDVLGLTADYISAFRATRLLDDDLTSISGATGENPQEVSSWYIPSQDELAFLAAHCIQSSPYDMNLNAQLLSSGCTPLDGWHWSSTGAFDESKGYSGSTGEGVIVSGGSTADAGTMAWAIKFDINGKENTFKAGKKNRTEDTYKVRPIRLIRCDGKYASGGQGNEKFWKLPKVLRDSDKNIN